MNRDIGKVSYGTYLYKTPRLGTFGFEDNPIMENSEAPKELD
jgi:hypothetical protein